MTGKAERRKKKVRDRVHTSSDKANHDFDILSLPDSFYNRPRIFYIDRDRLLKQDVNSSLDCLDSERSMSRGDCGDNNSVNVMQGED